VRGTPPTDRGRARPGASRGTAGKCLPAARESSVRGCRREMVRHPPRCPLKRVLCARTGQPAPCCICCCIARRVLSGVKPKLVWCWTREGWSRGTLTDFANLAFAITDAKARCTAQPATEEIARAWSRNHLVSFRRPSPREFLLHSTCLHGGVEWRHDERVACSGGTCGDGTNRPPEYSNAECLSGQCVYDCFLCTNCNFGNCKCK